MINWCFVRHSLLLPKIRVRIGEWDFSSTSESHPHVERKIAEKIVHPKYNYFTYEYDLALLKLEKRVDFADNIIPICLPGNNDLLIGNQYSVTEAYLLSRLSSRKIAYISWCTFIRPEVP